MARKSKPFFRQQTQSLYCTIDGNQLPLGQDKEAAFQNRLTFAK